MKIVHEGVRVTDRYRQPYMVVECDRAEGYQSDIRLVVSECWQCLACEQWFTGFDHRCAET